MKLNPGNIRKTVATSGTRERLSATSILATSVIIQGLAGNTGNIYVGGSDVSSALCMVELDAGVAITLSAADLGPEAGLIDIKDIWIDAGTSADGVNVGYLTPTPGTA